MRVIICGDRMWSDIKAIRKYILSLPPGSVIIEGECRGADKIARNICYDYGFEVLPFPADWRLGSAGGPIRNRQMIVEGKPDLVVAFHNNLAESRGTKDMIRQAREHGIPVEVRSSLSSAK